MILTNSDFLRTQTIMSRQESMNVRLFMLLLNKLLNGCKYERLRTHLAIMLQ